MIKIPPFVLSNAVRQFWKIREDQAKRQINGVNRDQGQRSSVTGGKQMDAFADAIIGYLLKAGVTQDEIFTRNRKPELPGFFRPTKQWDLLVIVRGCLLACLELKSQVGPSFGNNFNNRTEEAIGTAVDMWTAFREGVLGASLRPWAGYLFVLEDTPGSRAPIMMDEPHFKVLEEFRGASYAQRYSLLCRKLVRERHYDAACLILTDKARASEKENYREAAEDLTAQWFLAQLSAHVAAAVTKLRRQS